MTQKRHYKRTERNIFTRFLLAFGHVFKSIGLFFVRVLKAGNRKLTVMIVPHSQSKVINFQTNGFSLVTGFVLVLGIIGSFFFFNVKAADSAAEISRLMNENRQTLASLDELRSENSNLLQVAKKFQSTLNESLSLIGIAGASSTKEAVQSSDLSLLFDMQELTKGSMREAADVRQLSSYLEGAVEPVEQLGKLMESQGTLFSDIPSIWPLKGGIGHVSMMFGQNVHPMTGNWYIHKGMDFATWRSGDPIIATANGRVVNATYDDSFGYYVIIQHKYGYYTRYAHMSSFIVKKGQMVSQGDVIGYVGASGVATGAHLHYEVHIGSEVVDPANFINVKLTQ